MRYSEWIFISASLFIYWNFNLINLITGIATVSDRRVLIIL